MCQKNMKKNAQIVAETPEQKAYIDDVCEQDETEKTGYIERSKMMTKETKSQRK